MSNHAVIAPMSDGGLAFAHTRVHAARGRLVDVPALLRLRLADTPALRAAALAEIGLGDGSPLGAFRVLFARLVEDYACIARSLPGDRAPFLALLGRHEVENLKLVWRAVTRRHAPARWTPWWRPLGALEALRLGDFRTVLTIGDVVEHAAPTPYRSIVETLARAHAREPLAGEVALDRFASQRILDAAHGLGRRDADLAELLIDVVRERDAATLARAAAYGLDDAHARALALLPGASGREDPVARRRRDCRRAFYRGPFSRAPAAALLLLEEDRLAEVIAAAEPH